ncbi:MAG: hypothetical protein WCS90_06150 [Bacilli bacterium]
MMVGAGAILLGDITIGRCSRIGANEVVRHDVPPESVYVNGEVHVLKNKNGGCH